MDKTYVENAGSYPSNKREALRLAARNPDYFVRSIRGRWVVWSKTADHEVTFDWVETTSFYQYD
jgi:hypothetical protein